MFNLKTNTIEETMHVSFDENLKNFEDTSDEEDLITQNQESAETNNEINHPNKRTKLLKDHPIENILGDMQSIVKTRNQMSNIAFISTIEPKNPKEASTDDSWILAMQEELNQFTRNDAWELVPRPENKTIIRTKWVYIKNE